MEYLAIALILVAGVAWGDELDNKYCGKNEHFSGVVSSVTGPICYKMECQGVKVYEVKAMRNTVCWQCDRYICEGNGYEGEECYDSCSFDNSRYEQLKKMFKK